MSKRTCSTCRWVSNSDEFRGEYAMCNAPGNIKGSSTRTGFSACEPERHFKYCDTQRMGWPILADLFSLLLPTCGPLGRWWKPATAKAEVQS